MINDYRWHHFEVDIPKIIIVATDNFRASYLKYPWSLAHMNLKYLHPFELRKKCVIFIDRSCVYGGS